MFSGIAVSDLDVVGDWYLRLMRRPADVKISENEIMWRLIPAAAWLCLTLDRERAGGALLTISVDDLDFELAELATLGIEPDSRSDIPGSGRKAVMLDPDGNAVSLVQAG